MPKKSMLEYSKLILEKVSFDAKLFQKELKKAINRLLDHEIQELESWLRIKFQPHMELIPVPLTTLKQ